MQHEDFRAAMNSTWYRVANKSCRFSIVLSRAAAAWAAPFRAQRSGARNRISKFLIHNSVIAGRVSTLDEVMQELEELLADDDREQES